ncbi:MAG TPA: EpsI family protein [Fibrobacteria bacterium]|nr:EpsI family protein [Fibrobacteria bacterium]
MKRSFPILPVFALAAMAATAVLSNTVWFRQDIASNTRLTRHIPGTLGSWTVVEDSGPSEGEIRGLETTDIIKRTYSDGRNLVELVVAHIAHSSRKSAHAQESCLRGSGALVGSIYRHRPPSTPVDATVISIESRNRKSLVFYWYKIGPTYTSEYFRSSLLMFMGGLLGREAKGASLVRILTPLAPGEQEEAARARLDAFTGPLIPALEATLP